MVVVIDQEKDIVNSQQMTRQNVGAQTMKFGKVQTQRHAMVDLFNNNETSNDYFTLLSEKQGVHELQLIMGHIEDVPTNDMVPSASIHSKE